MALALVHARLAILDLSAAIHQPMVWVEGRCVIALNFNIDNHLELRVEFEQLGLLTFGRGDVN